MYLHYYTQVTGPEDFCYDYSCIFLIDISQRLYHFFLSGSRAHSRNTCTWFSSVCMPPIRILWQLSHTSDLGAIAFLFLTSFFSSQTFCCSFTTAFLSWFCSPFFLCLQHLQHHMYPPSTDPAKSNGIDQQMAHSQITKMERKHREKQRELTLECSIGAAIVPVEFLSLRKQSAN